MLIVNPFSRASIPEIISHNWMKYETRSFDIGSKRPSISLSVNSTCPPSPCPPCDNGVIGNNRHISRRFLSSHPLENDIDITNLCRSLEPLSVITDMRLKTTRDDDISELDITDPITIPISRMQGTVKGSVHLQIITQTQANGDVAICRKSIIPNRSMSSSSSRAHHTSLRPEAALASPFTTPKSSPKGSPKASNSSPKQRFKTLTLKTVNLTVKVDSDIKTKSQFSPSSEKKNKSPNKSPSKSPNKSPGKSPVIRSRRSTYSPKSSPLANGLSVRDNIFSSLILCFVQCIFLIFLDHI